MNFKTGKQEFFFPFMLIVLCAGNLINRFLRFAGRHDRMKPVNGVRERNYSMVYYNQGSLIIRNMQRSDAQVFTDEEIAQGWDADISKYETRLKDQAQGTCISLVAEYIGHPAGYVNVYMDSAWGAYGGMGYPEIVDFGVLEKYRRKGIGSKLMDIAEQIAGEYADTVYLGVGLHNGYGSAQRMYVKRGYVPDGSGVWYKDKPCTPYDTIYTNDDDLVLYLSKKLHG